MKVGSKIPESSSILDPSQFENNKPCQKCPGNKEREPRPIAAIGMIFYCGIELK
jgi:hypothetical protein